MTTETGGYRDEGAAQTGGYRDEGGRKPEKNLDRRVKTTGRGVISGTEVGPGDRGCNGEACDWRGSGAGIGGKSRKKPGWGLDRDGRSRLRSNYLVQCGLLVS